MSYMIKSACLSSDVYKDKGIIMKSYTKVKPVYVDIKGCSSIISVRHNTSLYIAFRGCKDIEELVSCIESKMVKPFINKSMLVNYAIWTKYEGIKDTVENIIDTSIDMCDNEMQPIYDIVFTGHSLGGALAQVAGSLYDKNVEITKKCVTLGAPYVGDKDYADYTKDMLDTNIRVAAAQDIIPKIKFNKNMVHSGEDMILQSMSKTPFPLSIYDHHSSVNYLKCLRKEA